MVFLVCVIMNVVELSICFFLGRGGVGYHIIYCRVWENFFLRAFGKDLQNFVNYIKHKNWECKTRVYPNHWL